MGEYNWLLVKIKVKVRKDYLWLSGVTTSWLEANMTKEYVLRIEYDPEEVLRNQFPLLHAGADAAATPSEGDGE